VIHLPDQPQVSANLAGALDAWRHVVGAGQVRTDEPLLAAAQTATFATLQRVLAVVTPGNRQEVQACVRIANSHQIPIYPVSKGKNWGYGSRVPTQDGAVLLDLGRMNRIVAVDEQLAYAVVEPGVTMRDLHAFLVERSSNLMMTVTGAPPESSLIGNTMERGIGQGLYADRVNHVCALEVVLPTGECIHTGFDRFAGAWSAPIARWGVGPSLDGLFTQSNLGIVTQMTMWLPPRPRHFQVLLGGLHADAGLEPLVDAFRELRLEGTLRSPALIFNDYKTLGLMRQYPWAETGGQTPLAPEICRRLVRARRATRWNVLAPLYAASGAQARADRHRVRRTLRGRLDRMVFLDRTFVRIARLASRPFRWLTGIDVNHYLDSIYTRSVFLGHPSAAAMASVFWRKREPTPPVDEIDPDRDRCGLLFCAPAIPFTGAHVVAAISHVERIAFEHGFEPNINLSCLTDRMIDLVVFIVFDRGVAGEDRRAQACHDDMLRSLTEAGYIPYRLGLQSMGQLPPARDDTGAFYRTLKAALDPNHVLAPGRYEFFQ
jgi:4-cresol dehydrogenase (hydroxylating)